METARKISTEKLARKIGNEIEVIVDEIDDEGQSVEPKLMPLKLMEISLLRKILTRFLWAIF